MKRFLIALCPLALAIVAASCSSDSDDSSGNGVPNPTGGSAGKGGSTSSSGGKSGAGTGGTAAKAGTGGASAGEPGNNAGEPGVGEGGEGGAPATVANACADLPGTIVYIESGDTQENLLKNLGRQLRDTADITLVFNLTGSCTLTNDIYTGAKVVPNGSLKYIPSTAEDPTWTTAKAEATCNTGAAGVPVDLAISALFVQSCGLGDPPAGSNLDLIQGPIQAYTFVVPNGSDQTAITAEEGYYTFGFGNANPLAPMYDPWNNDKFMFIRPVTKSTLVATAKNINVPPNKWKGVPEAASGDVVSAVAGATNAEAAIGILGAEVYDGDRSAGIKTLAFQAHGQSAAYYPDSAANAFDKQNLRDGHYTLWSPTVYITPVDGSHVPKNPAVKYVEDLVLGSPDAAPPGGGTAFDALADVVKVGLIPECAMQVTRSEDGGDLSPYTPAEACTCYYLSKIPGATGTPTGCTACTSAATCGGGACNHGFCEPNAIDTSGTTPAGCVSTKPATNADLINACTNATTIKKTVVLPAGDPVMLP